VKMTCMMLNDGPADALLRSRCQRSAKSIGDIWLCGPHRRRVAHAGLIRDADHDACRKAAQHLGQQLGDAREEIEQLRWELRKLTTPRDHATENALERQRQVYYALREGSAYIKIGSATNVSERLRDLARGGVVMPTDLTPGPMTLLAVHRGGLIAEHAMHDRFAALRVAGEWFRMETLLTEHIELVRSRMITRGEAA